MKANRPLATALLLRITILSGLSSCGSDRLFVPPDTTAPALQILSPTIADFDLNGDHLVDVSLRWSDVGGAIDTGSVVVRSLIPINGAASTTTNLRSAWRVTVLDSTGILLHETLDNLLPSGTNQLVVSVADTAGNKTTDTVAFALPAIVFFDSIATGVTSSTANIRSIAIDRAGRFGYAGVSSRVIVFDAESLRILANVPSGSSSQVLRILLDEPRGLAYVSSVQIQRLDLQTQQLVGSITGSFATAAMAYSRTGSPLLYAGESNAGWLGYIALNTAARVDVMQIPHVQPEFINDLVVTPNDAKLYMTRYDGGLLVINPATKQILRNIQLLNGGPFFTDDLELTADNQFLFVTVRDGVIRGVAVMDTQTDSVVRFLDLQQYVPSASSLSPSNRRLFITTFDVSPSSPSSNLLVDASTFALLGEIPRPRPPGTVRRDGIPVFRPDGKLVFVGRELTVDVYLNRESP